MKEKPSQFPMSSEENGSQSSGGEFHAILRGEKNHDDDRDDELAAGLQCVSFRKPKSIKGGKELSLAKNVLWRQDQRNRAAKLEKQLQSRYALNDLIEEQLYRFRSHYVRSMVPTKLRDVPQLLFPKWIPSHELAVISWLGDWRPSAIMDLCRGLARSSYFSASLVRRDEMIQTLSQLIHDIRIEEAIIDEEMAEIQATCILHLPFAPFNTRISTTSSTALASVHSQFKKTERVIMKAQHLRFKVLEMVLKRVLNQMEAAEFLVAFDGVQDTIHQFATQQSLDKGPVSISMKALDSN